MRTRALLAVLIVGFVGVSLVTAINFIGSRLLPPYGDPTWTDERKADSMRAGEVLVRAIEAYHKDHNSYPKTLDELLPAYLSKITKPTAGEGQWRYSSTTAGFFLQFATSDGYPSCNYY